MAIKASAQVSITDVSDGEEGKGVASVTPEYYLSSSKTTQSDGSWSTTPPTWASGKYLWVRQIVTYTDSSVSRTQPYCDTSWEAVNEIEVGGRNLVLATATPLTLKNDGSGQVTSAAYKYKDIETAESLDETTVTMSFDYTNEISSGSCYFNVYYNWHNIRVFNTSNTGSGHYVKTIQLNDAAHSGTHAVYLQGTFTGTVTISNFKLEKGNKATDWSPAPEDVETSINTAQSTADTAKTNAANAQSTADTARTEAADAAKTATNYLHYDSNGLTVSGETFATGGNPSGKNIRINSNGVNIRNGGTVLASYGASTTIGSTSGRHILIDSDSVDIKNGDTVLSQFTDNTIYLGKNSTTSTIDFCNGNGYILGRDDSTYGKGLWVDGGDRMYIVSNKELFITASEKGSDNDPRIHMEYSGSNSTLNIISPKISIAGDTAFSGNVTSNICFGSPQLYIGPSGKDGANGVGGALNNLVLASWWGISFTGTYGTYTGKTAVGIDCRDSIVYANTFNGTATNADKVDGKHANDIFKHIGLQTCGQVDANTRGCFNVNLTEASIGWLNAVQFEQGHFITQLGFSVGEPCSVFVRTRYAANSFIDWNTGWTNLGTNIVIGTSSGTIAYKSGYTKAVVEFWKTTVGSTSRTIYDSTIITGLSSSMTAVTPSSVSSGPDFAFAVGNSSSGQIIISGNFTKYKITYFN